MKRNTRVSLIFSFFLLLPLFGNAETTSTDAIALLQNLENKMAAIQAQMIALQNEFAQVKNALGFSALSAPTPQRGETSDEVRKVQEFLTRLPDIYPRGLVTGYFGDLTGQALLRFQAKYGVPQTGLIDPATRAKITELRALTAATSTPPQILPTSTLPVATLTPVATSAATTPAITTSTATSSVLALSPRFSFVFPLRGDQFLAGNTSTIQWNSSEQRNTIPTVRLSLYKDGLFKEFIAADTPNTGGYAWTPPERLAGGPYTIGIFSVLYPTRFFESAPFLIATSSSNNTTNPTISDTSGASPSPSAGPSAPTASSTSTSSTTSSAATSTVASSSSSNAADNTTISAPATVLPVDPGISSLVGHWKFDGNGNNEISGGPAAVTVGSSVFQSSGGNLGGYAYIPGSSDSVKIPYSSSFDLQNFTIEFWFRQRSNQSFNQNLIYKGYAPNNYNFYILRYLWNQYNNGPVIAGSTSANTGYWHQASNPNEPPHNTWHHVVYTRNSEAQSYYIDGSLIHSRTYSQSPEYSGPVRTPATDIIIADTAVDTDIDNLRIYNRALTHGEALYNYNGGMGVAATPIPQSLQAQFADITAAFARIVNGLQQLLAR